MCWIGEGRGEGCRTGWLLVFFGCWLLAGGRGPVGCVLLDGGDDSSEG